MSQELFHPAKGAGFQTKINLEELWKEFGNVCVDNNDRIDTKWRGFKKGTSRFEVWRWFEDQSKDFSVAKHLYNIGREECLTQKPNSTRK
jgi:hypothetical protein